MDYRYGSHTVYQIEYHFVWVTKHRYKVLRGEVTERLREQVRQTCEASEIRIVRGVVSKDHVHILVSAPPNLAPSEIMRRIKGRTASYLFEEFPHLKKRYWGQHFWVRGHFVLDGKLHHAGYELIQEVWAESFTLERPGIDAEAQAKLDRIWKVFDEAAAGDYAASTQVRLWRRFGGPRRPESRVITPSTLGLMISDFFGEGQHVKTITYRSTSRCSVCDARMAVKSRRHIYCSPVCAETVRKARFKRCNDKRQPRPKAEVTCQHCGEAFTAARSDAKYCSGKCRVAAHRANHPDTLGGNPEVAITAIKEVKKHKRGVSVGLRTKFGS